ncbi:hypothetical protein OlV1_031c [Ostreococcus lucimarinus virus 1]|jgi:hypothetical protein|uniref:hypothetical protein n=1 Tax=Ostreococcus lucimarinus virus 1 TaxID=880162 RepID=UPI0001EF4553|nr:hypothetical protein OlV1_031c [Ostreococcus lucimarinus virus 1]ADQ91408.1 hypothetical protein OlV1_031c [Ostreococcus lucimarinus virus 1]AET84481.1 hypothetical protein OLOG_00015 [Ostreococcus lucimarinus virus OlV4]QBP06669.1 hypothetical protein OlV1_gene217 [Ostreococcus lucimarinus virus 1]
MNNAQKGTWIAIALGVTLIAVFMSIQSAEKYRPVGADYRYGMVDTNPERRTGQFFDTCSPENMADCSRNNPYEGLPLP